MRIQYRDHTLTVPWSYEDSSMGTLELYAREVYYEGNESKPYIVYLQGGPGFPSPRPGRINSWIEPLLERFRVILLDQRGTGRSTRVDSTTPAFITAEHISLLRADNIIRDCEELRRSLGISRWSLYGQSFGGFCILTYLSFYPDSIDMALMTGGLAGIERSAEEIYRSTYGHVARRLEGAYRKYPWLDERIRQICLHLDNTEEYLPTGEQLTSRRFRMLGINAGRGRGYEELAALCESPFSASGRLSGEFLYAVGPQLSFGRGPLYAAIHEAIYAIPGQSTGWAAHRVREEIEGFSEYADPANTASPYYLTGEHIFPWQFEEDPALMPFKELAWELARKTDWPALYDKAGIARFKGVVAACVYHDDIFVPYEYSMETAALIPDCRLHITNEYQHDGISHNGAGILRILLNKVEEF